ncbi:MAG TPA: SBBP repeat-containing protein [Chthoniobacterales bacterium]|nr:SBBP repeat-containing protein [Chthoniobacterales bacterium]
MKRFSPTIPACLLIVTAVSSTAFSQCPDTTSSQQRQSPKTYGPLPVAFEANRGQSDAQVRFISRGSGYCLFLTSNEAVLALHPTLSKSEQMADRLSGSKETRDMVLRMKLADAKATPEVTGMEELPGKVNYFIGNDATQWRRDISTYARVTYHDVYPGVDLVYHGEKGQLEYDLVLAPGADPGIIAVDIDGSKTLTLNPEGDLLLDVESAPLTMRKPRVYQEINGKRHAVAGSYVLRAPRQIGFLIGNYDRTKPLIIDPVLVYSTFLGGGRGTGIAVDKDANAYVIGTTPFSTFATVSAFQPTSVGNSAIVAKLTPAGDAVIYATYLGGNSASYGNDIAVDNDGNAYLTGLTSASDFPTVNPFQASNGGGVEDAFVTKLNCRGNDLIYSTYLGVISYDGGNGIAVDGAGHAYVTGYTFFKTFPLQNPAQSAFRGMEAFVTKFNPAGNGLVYSTFLGGKTYDYGLDIALDAAGNAYVTGWTLSNDFPTLHPAQSTYGGGGDAFITKLNATGNQFIYSTYLGGSGEEYGFGIAVDGAGSAYVTGYTKSTNFPTVNPAQPNYGGELFDAFVTKLNSTGSLFVYSTYLGGSGGDIASAIAVDGTGKAYVTGYTYSTDFPVVNSYQSALAGQQDAFVTRLDGPGNLSFSTYLGGSMTDQSAAIAVDDGGIYITGASNSNDFPLVNPYQVLNKGAGDGFVAKIWIPDPVPSCCGQIVIAGIGATALGIVFIFLRQRRRSTQERSTTLET